jgi:putative protein-disulfide isomerase
MKTITEEAHARQAEHQKRNQPLKKTSKNNCMQEQAGSVKINFFTDPLCCWSHGFDPAWRKLLAEYGERIRFEYVMCGMIPDWKTYNDPLNSITKPMQMGPLWMYASQISGVEMDFHIWHTDPPSSSYPSCIAVKCARLQSATAADRYLLAARTAVMRDGINIAKEENLLAIAKKLSVDFADFDFNRFESDLKSGEGKDLFRQDLQLSKFHSIGRYPTLTIQNSAGKGVIIVGYRPYEILVKALEQIKN